MIEKKQVYVIGEQMFRSFEEAQRSALREFLKAGVEDGQADLDHMVDHILAGRAQVVDILTMTERSRAKARKANGATRKKRTAKPRGIVAVPVSAV